VVSSEWRIINSSAVVHAALLGALEMGVRDEAAATGDQLLPRRHQSSKSAESAVKQ